MARHLTDFSSQHSNLENEMENSNRQHMNQIRETSGLELILENKGIESEVDWKSKVGWFLTKVQSSRFGYRSST